MLPIEFKPALLAFLSGIDLYVSDEVTQTKGRVGEVATTGRLLRCLELDPNINPPIGLHTTPAALRAQLEEIAAQLPGQPDVGFELKGEGLSQIFEGRISQADYALHLSYEDTSGDIDQAKMQSWDAYYFIQAKIAKTPGEEADRSGHVWDSNAKFSITKGQPFAIECARELLGSSGLKYNLYCPSESLKLDARAYFYGKLRDYFPEKSEEWRQVETAGLWLSGKLPRTLGDLLNSNDPTVCTWALFVLDHYFARGSGRLSPRDIIFRNVAYDKKYELMNRKALFERDAAFIDKLQNHLVSRGAKKRLDALHMFTTHGYQPSIKIVLKFPGYDYINTPVSPAPFQGLP